MSEKRSLYLLDTNVCIVYLKGKSLSVIERFKSLLRDNIAVCSIVKAELFYGSMRSNNPKKAFQVQETFLNQFVYSGSQTHEVQSLLISVIGDWGLGIRDL